MSDVDLVVIGSGPNGLAAAICAARAGWSVVVLEAQPAPGGAVRSDELTIEGFTHDTFSAFYPFGVSSPVFDSFDLSRHGLVWRWADIQNAHPAPDGDTAIIAHDADATEAALDKLASGDGHAWARYQGLYRQIEEPLVDTLYTPLPNASAAAKLAWRARKFGLLDFARFGLLSVRRLGDEWFAGEGVRRMLAGLALHSDLAPEAVGSGMYANMLAWVGQQYGFPVPEGGAGALSAALVAELESRGGRVACSSRVTDVDIDRGRVTAVRIADGTQIGVRRAVFADIGPPALFLGLVGEEHLPAKLMRRLDRFEWGAGAFKIDWALDGAVPWNSEPARRSATVHLGDSVDDLSRYANEFTRGLIPDHPYLLLGQQCVADPTRAPQGQSTLWGYTHVPTHPQGDAAGVLGPSWRESAEGFADRCETRIEALAPGFRDRILARRLMTPADLEARNANLVGGDISGGSFAVWQQVVFRPLPGMFRYRTPIRGLYLCSASTHPGGGVHGGCGAAAFAVARSDARLKRI